MAELPNNLTRQDIYDLQEAAQRFYPSEIQKIKNGVPASRWGKWPNKKAFDDDVFTLTGLKDIVKAYDQLGKWAVVAPVKTEQVESVPQNIKALTEEATKKEADRQKLIAESNRKVREQISSAQEAHQRIQDSKPKIYAKVIAPETPQLSDQAQAVLNDLKQNPSIPNIAVQIEKSIAPSLQDKLTPDQIHIIALDSAYKAVDAANNPQKYIESARQSAILNAVAEDNTVLPKVIKDVDVLNNLRIGANELGTFTSLQPATARMLWSKFDPELGKTLFPNPNDYQVSFSQEQAPGFNTVFSPDGMIQGYSSFLTSNLEFFGKLAGLSLDKFESEMMSKATSWIEGQIVSNFPRAATFFAAPQTQLILSGLGIGTTTIDLSGSLGGFFIKNPGALKAVNFFSSGYGINFGTGSAATGGTLQTGLLATGPTAVQTGATLGTEAIVETGAVVGGEVAVGTAAPPIGVILAALAVANVVRKAAQNVISKVVTFLKENKLESLSVAIPAGLIAGAFFGIPTAIGIGAVTFIGTSFITGGTAGVGSSLAGVGATIFAFLGVLWATFLAAVAGPLFTVLIGIPVSIALILFIINSGAYVVPPGDLATASTNPYISVTKVANPSGQLPSPTKITYTITITAKKDSLTDITIKGECHAQTESGTLSCPKEDIPTGDQIPDAINAGSPFTFTFTSDYGNIFQDSLVSNTITVTANSPSGGEVTETGSASVCFGKCPLDCFAFPDQYWPNNSDVQKLKSLLTEAASTLAGKYPNFAAKVCKNGTVNLCYKPSIIPSGIFGWHEHGGSCDIDFNTRVSSYGSEGTLYLLAHEATHHIQKIDGSYRQKFDDQVAPREPSICTYGGNDPDESMAEGDGLYVAKPVIYAAAGCVPNYQSKYPLHYNFAKNVMFAP